MTAAPPARGAVRAAFWRGRRVLLTGNTGFKGAWLSLWLQQLGAELTGFSRGAPTDPSLFALVDAGAQMQNIEGDVRDHAALTKAVAAARPEVVIHMAAQPLVRRSFEDPRLTYETNVMGTVNLLDAVRLAGGGEVRVVVNVTTDKVYETREWEWGYREGEQLGGHDPYASSKACAELVTSAFRLSFLDAAGTQTATARAGNVIGGGDWAADRLVPDAIRAALAGTAVKLRNPSSIRPWQHVLNPLSGYMVLAQDLWEPGDSAAAWNFGPPEDDAQPASWIVERLAERWPGLSWAADPGPHPHEAAYLKLDSSRARARLGWRPAVSLGDALDSVADWHRACRDGEDMRAVTLAQIARLTDG